MADTAFKTGTPGNLSPFFTHTAAPWHAERGCIYAGEGATVHCLAEIYGGAVATKAEADADARLMAAAPELLASLLALLDANHSGEPVRLARAVRSGFALLARLLASGNAGDLEAATATGSSTVQPSAQVALPADAQRQAERHAGPVASARPRLFDDFEAGLSYGVVAVTSSEDGHVRPWVGLLAPLNARQLAAELLAAAALVESKPPAPLRPACQAWALAAGGAV